MEMWPGVWPGVATATTRASAVSGLPAAKVPKGPPSRTSGSNRTSAGMGCRSNRWASREARLRE